MIAHALRLVLAASLMLAACSGQTPLPEAPASSSGPALQACPEPQCPACPPSACPACPPCPEGFATKPPPVRAEPLQPTTFTQLAGWQEDDHAAALAAFRRGCRALEQRPDWKAVCEQSAQVGDSRAAARAFFERAFVPHRIVNADGGASGLVTGYYEPLLRGSRARSAEYAHPIHAAPDDLLIVDLADVSPELKGTRLRGRIEGRRVVPYYSRAEIAQGRAPAVGKALLWVDDPIELFFLQVQGSGRVRLPTGEQVRVGYADQNGHPYRSIGRYLVDLGELRAEQASMQGIKHWARAHPGRLEELLNHNPRYVFFRELPADGIPAGLGAPGSLGVPLTPGRSIAVDARYVPLGAPVFLATTEPNSSKPLRRLVVAQDTGGAIVGPVRADFFWGFGPDAGAQAGRMRQTGAMWALLPRDLKLPASATR